MSNRTRQQFTVGDLSCRDMASSVDRITDYNDARVRCFDKARSRTRVNTGSAFQHWRELKEREGQRSDAKVALFLLDRRVTLVLLCFTELIIAVRMCGAELSK